MRATYITAVIIALLILAWLFSGTLGEEPAPPPGSLAEQNAQQLALAEDHEPTKVRARVFYAQQYTENMILRGRTENKRTVMVRSETAGRIIDRPVERGDRVTEGDPLCRIAMDDRQAGLTEAREALNQAQIEYKGALKLKAQGFQSDTAIAQAKAKLAATKAQVERRKIEIARTTIRAPFGGQVENTGLEVGDYVSPGGVCATIVDLDPMLLVGEVAEVSVARLNIGEPAVGLLADGRRVEGVITFIGQQSNAKTRTYPIEIQVDNADLSLRSGITAEIQLPLDQVVAHHLSPALLALDDGGDIGIRTLDEDQRVVFNHVKILDDDNTGVWLTGLPERATVITVGQELVVAGERVEVEFEPSEDMPAQAPTPGATETAPATGLDTGLLQMHAEPVPAAVGA